MEGFGERQEGRGLQHQRRERPSQGPIVCNLLEGEILH
jgi:hypothetical protein